MAQKIKEKKPENTGDVDNEQHLRENIQSKLKGESVLEQEEVLLRQWSMVFRVIQKAQAALM
jgi:hypothetical protein